MIRLVAKSPGPVMQGLSERERVALRLRYWARGRQHSTSRRLRDGSVQHYERCCYPGHVDCAKVMGLRVEGYRSLVKRARAKVRVNMEGMRG
jgi:DNA-directed RNA polymerase specialized sigma24 family protein